MTNRPDEQYPILYLEAESGASPPERLTGGPSDRRKPTRSEQSQRLGPSFSNLSQQMAAQRARVLTGPTGTEPELVIVFEVAGDVETFYSAASRIDGLEFLLGAPDDRIEADAIFAVRDASGVPVETGLPATVMVVLSNRAAVREIQSLWRRYGEAGRPRFPQGFGPWRELFDLLVDVRPWGPEDRARLTGVADDLARRLEFSPRLVRAELDLWCRSTAADRDEAERAARDAVGQAGGRVVAQSVIEEIAYHALLIEFPSDVARQIVNGQEDAVPFLTSDAVAFLRPQAQSVSGLEAPGADRISGVLSETSNATGAPLIAILDGVPQLGHDDLVDRIMFDDPDDFQSSYPVSDRQHGTAVASVVLNGDLNASVFASNPVYFRPVLQPFVDYQGRRVEAFPNDGLPVDLVHRCVVRMFEGPEPVAPSIKVINLSIGDASTVFAAAVSPFARLLDYLSSRYSVLFIVSSGNHDRPIHLGCADAVWSAMDDPDARAVVLRAMGMQALTHRLLSPSEAVNVLTVGALHDDDSGVGASGPRVDPLPGSGNGSEALPSPLSAVGDGFNRSVKPDVTAPGGRVLFTKRSGPSGDLVLEPRHSSTAGPGVLVAAPGASGQGRNYSVGTSVAAAHVTHRSAEILELLTQRAQVPDELIAPATKALLVHFGGWGPSASEIIASWPHPLAAAQRRAVASRFLGYGTSDHPSTIPNSAQSVTLINFGQISSGSSVRLRAPVPISLGGRVGLRSITITLAGMVPTDATHKAHRAARLYFRPTAGRDHRVTRVGADWHSVMNGSLQHEILQGNDAVPYQAGSTFDFQVSCRAIPESRIVDPIPYVVLFTIATGIAVPVHAEVRQALQLRAQGRVRVLG